MLIKSYFCKNVLHEWAQQITASQFSHLIGQLIRPHICLDHAALWLVDCGGDWVNMSTALITPAGETVKWLSDYIDWLYEQCLLTPTSIMDHDELSRADPGSWEPKFLSLTMAWLHCTVSVPWPYLGTLGSGRRMVVFTNGFHNNRVFNSNMADRRRFFSGFLRFKLQVEMILLLVIFIVISLIVTLF